MLVIWTSAEVPLVKKTFGPALTAQRPAIPEHRFEAVSIAKDGSGGELPQVAKGDFVLAAGGRALTILSKAGAIPKNRTLTSLRQKLWPHKGVTYMLTFDPGSTSSNPENIDHIQWDVQLACRYLKTGSLAPEIGKYEWVTNLQPFIDEIEAQFDIQKKPIEVAFDTETMGFYPWYADKDIVMAAFSRKAGTAVAVYVGPQKPPVPWDPSIDVLSQIEWLLTSPKVSLRAANGKYDMVWVKEKWGIQCTNFKFDTMLAGTLLDENRANSLNLHAKIFTTMGGYDDEFNNTQDKGHMEAIPTDLLLPYGAGDPDATLRVAKVLKNQLLEDEQLSQFYVTILHPAARAFEEIERRGIIVNQEKLAVLRQDLCKEIAEGQREQMDLLPGKLKFKHREKIEGQTQDGKNPLTPAIIKDYFFSPSGLNLKPKMVTPKSGEPSTAKSHLTQFAEHPDAKAMVAAMTKADKAAKTLSTFVDGFQKHLRPDNRLHPTFFLGHSDFEEADDEDSGTVTGRLSAKNPAFQTLPKKTNWAKRLRECYEAPLGKLVLQCDYSQGELKIVACVANEKTMIEAYRNGLDLHAVTGAKIAGIDLAIFLSYKDHVDKELAAIFDSARDRAKPANFGLLYGMSAEGFMHYAWASYGKKFTLAEAEAIRNAFFALYPGLTDYHNKQKNLVRMHEMVRSPLGRIRHLPTIRSWDRAERSKAERQAINSPIQSCLNDMMLWAIAEIEANIDEDDLAVVGTIHDAFMGYVDASKAADIAREATNIMASLPLHDLGWEPQLRFTADAEAGPDLAHLTKFKFAA